MNFDIAVNDHVALQYKYRSTYKLTSKIFFFFLPMIFGIIGIILYCIVYIFI